ncbi:MAG: methyltransferase type 11 [Brevundimonas sp.]|uniref:methyltransferase type 11 n=1 Tax=Brevundimonas sp. TaxID=1871086 RepID=UPI0025C2C9A5|nr:methyltransferase type 11 [Brevundimonas sp.]MBX3476234.1 methyltransferase type 11 [Brevundimonas sp.]
MRPTVATRSILPLLLMTAALGACKEPSVRISTTHTDDDDKGGVLKVIDALQCPQTQGVLTRKGSAIAGGAVCTYTGPKGAEVSLHLVMLDGQPSSEVLKTFERQLAENMARSDNAPDADEQAAEARAIQAEANAAQAKAEDAAATAAAASDVAIDANGDRARVRLPGISIDAQGDSARVRIGGLNIRADDSSGVVDLRSDDETVRINASSNGAEVRTRRNGDATRSSWTFSDSRGSDQGWRVVGYEARGPMGGPIVVAAIRVKEREQDAVFEAAKALVTLNVGR